MTEVEEEESPHFNNLMWVIANFHRKCFIHGLEVLKGKKECNVLE
jgi:hypothetical protein